MLTSLAEHTRGQLARHLDSGARNSRIAILVYIVIWVENSRRVPVPSDTSTRELSWAVGYCRYSFARGSPAFWWHTAQLELVMEQP